MKIGLVIYESLDILSGGYLYDRKLVENLTAIGDEVAILSLKWRPYPLCLLDNFSTKVMDMLLSHDFDVLLQDELAHASLFHVNKAIKQSRNTPIVGIIHHLRASENHPALWMRLYQKVEKRYLNSLDGMICNSNSTRRSVDNVTEQRLPAIVAYPAVDHYDLGVGQGEKKTIQADLPLRILFVGNIIPRKGLHVLIEALAKFRGESWSMTVAGSPEFDPQYSRRMVKLAAHHLPTDKVSFTGRVSDTELRNLYLNHDLLVVPSEYEGFGIVYLEAMHLGLVPIGSTGGGAGEIISNHKDGFLINPGDAEGLAGILKSLILDPRKLISLKTKAMERAGLFQSWRENAKSIRNFLVELIGSYSRVQSG